MALKLNNKGFNHAKSLIKQGKIDYDSSWSMSADDENKILYHKGEEPDWEEYSKWFLAIDPEADEETKARYKFPYGKNGKVYRRGVIAAKQRAAQNGYENIEKAADELLQMIDEKQGKKKEKALSEFELKLRKTLEFPQRRNFDVAVDAIDEEQKIVTLSFSSEYPVERWFGKEILLHGKDNVDYSRFLEVGSVLRNHDYDKPVAVPLKVWIDQDRKGRAVIQFKDTEESRKAFEEVKQGLIRGVSAGYIINQYRYLEEGEVYENWEGPALIALRWSIIEISLTPIPSDPTVGIGRSVDKQEKKHKEVEKMGEKVLNNPTNPNPEELKRAQELERQRILEIRNLCSEFNIPAEMEEKFITEGVSIEDVRAQVLDYLAKTRVPAGQVVAGEDARDKFVERACYGLMVRAGVVRESDVPEKLDGWQEFRGMTLVRLAEECLRRAGVNPLGMDRMTLVREAFTHTSSDFPYLLDTTIKKTLAKEYKQVPSTYEEWTVKVSAPDFNKRWALQLGSFKELELVPEGGEYKETTFSVAKGEEYSVDTWGAIFTLTRKAIVNDDLNVFNRIPRMLAQSAKRTIEKKVYNLLLQNPTLSDGKTLFSTDHKNLGTAGAISATTLNEIRQLMGKQTDIDGNPILLKPGYLIIPPALEIDAWEWMNNTFYPATTKNPNTKNPFANWAKPISTPYISSLVDGGSDTAWYVVVDKNYAEGVWVAFLDGQETPTVESKVGFEIDGMAFKVRVDFGVAVVDYRALYKNAGA